MNIGIYNRSLPTLGGGERHSLSMAEHLSQGHQTTFISHEKVTPGAVKAKLNLDLSRVKFLVFPSCAARDLEKMTTRFDCFINASFQRFFPARAGHNILMTYFPSPFGIGISRKTKQEAARLLKRIFILPTLNNCSASLVYEKNEPVLHSLPAFSLDLPKAKAGYSIYFQIASGHRSVGRATVYLNDQPLRKITFPDGGKFVACEIKIPRNVSSVPNHFLITTEEEDPGISDYSSALLIKKLKINHPGHLLFGRLSALAFPDWKNRLFRLPVQIPPIKDCIDTYQTIWTISDYSRDWIKKYWDRDSHVLNPPVNVHQLYSGEKGRRILSVGRFFPEMHNKKHPVMMAAFKKMVDQGLQDWELHLVGGTKNEKSHQRYLKKLSAESQDYPIFIHPDLPYPDLVALYSGSSIYWHACGYGENAIRNPEKFEHFGITTVESMASGCVPVVFGRGGQREIVRHGRNGFLWDDLNQLIQYTWRLIRDPSLTRQLSEAARGDSRRFDISLFNSRLSDLISAAGF